MKETTYGLKKYQLLNIIEQYNERNQNEKIIKYKTKNIAELEKMILLKIGDIRKKNYKIIETNIYAPDIYKKAGINKYNTLYQEEFINNLNQNERFKNPLQALNEYRDKEGKIAFLTPQDHQRKFILQFIYSTLRGSVCFHGVGSGKTLTAVISSYYYLKLYPNNKVIVISPSALLYNFVSGMVQYGLDKNDNRYSFYTYDKYVRNPELGKNALLIVDEAHNLRTFMNVYEQQDPETGQPLHTASGQPIYQSMANKRGFKIWNNCARMCHKIILLTGTMFINRLYDIENLLAMVDARVPETPDSYEIILEDVNSIKDYFNYKISYYVKDDETKKSDSEIFFPRRNEKILAVYMNEDEEKKYNSIKNNGYPKPIRSKKSGDGDGDPNAFYSAEKYASNMIGKNENKKLDEIIKLIKANPLQKYIIYSNLNDYGVLNIEQRIIKEFGENKVVKITGKQNTTQKEDSKLYFNYYDFNGKINFDFSLNLNHSKYQNSTKNIMLITRAGAEGVDTINCQNMIIYDSQWNDALTEQIIARAIRFKSHHGLPPKERYVNVYRILYCFEDDKKIINDIQKGKVDFIKLNEELKDEVHQQLKDIKINSKAYLPTLKELKELKLKDKIFIPAKSEYRTIKGMWGRQNKTELIMEGWDMYEILSKDHERKNWRTKMYYKWKSINDNNMTPEEILEREQKLKDTLHSVDLKLYIMAKSKQARIDDFISHLGKAINLYESYESKIINMIRKEEMKKQKPLTEEEKIQIYRKEHNEEKNEILKFKLLGETKNERNKKNRLQQFFTGELLSQYVFEYSSLRNAHTNINILEPTAGVGALIKPILTMIDDKKLIDLNIDLVEIDIENRKSLLELQKKAPTIIKVLNQNNVLTFKSSTRYDYIFMNPPFHLRQNEDKNLRGDVYDYDFIMKAFGILKVGGELMCITGGSWLNDKSFIKWTQNKKLMIFEYKVINEIETKTKDEAKRKREMLKFSGTKVKTTITVIKITKLSEEMDNEILSRRFYKSEGTLGEEITNGGISINKVFQTPPKATKYNDSNKEEIRKLKEIQELKEIRELEEELNNILTRRK